MMLAVHTGEALDEKMPLLRAMQAAKARREEQERLAALEKEKEQRQQGKRHG